MTSHKVIDYINENFSLVEELQNYTNFKPSQGKVFCPFHHNVNTPAAKLYGNKLKCFGECNRMFGVYDVLKRWDPKRIDEIKSKLISTTVKVHPHQPLKHVDLSLPIDQVIKQILE